MCLQPSGRGESLLRDDRVMVKSGIRKAGSESWLCQLLALLLRLGKALVSLILNILSGKQRVSQVPPWRFTLKSKQDGIQEDLKVTQ